MKNDFKNSFKDFDNGVKAYEQGEYEKTGETIARIFGKMAKNEQQLSTEPLGDKAHDMAEVMQGFLEGAKLGKFDFTALLECIMVADKTAIFAYQDVELALEAWKKKDWQEAVGAIITAVGVYQGVEQSVGVCKQVDPAWGELKFNPLGLRKQEVQDKLQEAFDAQEQGKLFEFGKDLGEAISATSADKNLFVF